MTTNPPLLAPPVLLLMLLMLVLAPSLAAAAPKPAATSATSATKPVTTGPASRPAAAPTRRNQSDAAAAAVRAAVVVLTKEYDGYLRNAGTAARETSNYFKEHRDDAVSAEAVVAAVQARTGGDPRTSAYVKWQLLSALPADASELDPALAKQLLSAYRTAPQPVARPGISPQDQQKLDIYLQGRKEAEEPDIRAYLDTAVSQVARQNAVVLRYRDELYRRLPKGPETFAAALDDLMQRMNAVADGKELAKLLCADVRQWATLEARPPQTLLLLARAARRLADTKGPQYYTSPSWRGGTNLFAWNKSRAAVAGADALKDTAVYLEEVAAQPQLELKEKK